MSVRKSTGLAVNAPSYVKEGARGLGKMDQSDASMPFLRLAQDKTPQVLDELVERGVFFNSVTNQVYGEELDVLVVAAQTSRMRFGDYAKKEGILCQAPNGVHAMAPGGRDAKGHDTDDCGICVLKDWGKDRQGKSVKPTCMKQGKYLVLVPGETVPMVFVLQSTNYPAARRLNTILLGGGTDTFAHVIKLAHHKGEKSDIIDVSKNGWAEEKDYRQAEKLFGSMAKSLMGQQLDLAGEPD